MLELVLKEEQVVGRRHSDDVLVRVPRRVQDLPVEVKTVHTDLLLLLFASREHLRS